MAMNPQQAAAKAAKAFADYSATEIRARARRRSELKKCTDVLTLDEIGAAANPPLSKGRVSQILSEEPDSDA